MAEQGINTYNEKPLHAALKVWYAGDSGQLEVPIAGYIVDVVRDDVLIEIQTGNFSKLKEKLRALTADYQVVLAYPIPLEKWIVKLDSPDAPDFTYPRRKSPKRGTILGLFYELVSFPDLVAHPNFTLDVLFTREDEVRRYDPRRRRRRRSGWVVKERRLLEVVERRRFTCAVDFAPLLPDGLKEPFTTRTLATALGCNRRLAGRAAYCFREMGLIEDVGRRRRSILYRRS